MLCSRTLLGALLPRDLHKVVAWVLAVVLIEIAVVRERFEAARLGFATDGLVDVKALLALAAWGEVLVVQWQRGCGGQRHEHEYQGDGGFEKHFCICWCCRWEKNEKRLF